MSETIDGLKQRLVGAFVILSLAIIFLPMIFDQPHFQSNHELVPVPPKPAYKTVIIKEPQKPEFKKLQIDPVDKKVKKVASANIKPTEKKPSVKIIPKSSAASKTTKKSGVVAVTKKRVKPITVTKKNTSPKVSHLPIFKKVWMVQLGTFTSTKNAFRLRDKLRKDGFVGHTKEVKLEGKSAIRVFTGPFVNKLEATKTKQRLDKKYKVDSRLTFFDA